MNPLRAVGKVMRASPGFGPPFKFLGSCFSLRWNNRFVTAAHCVDGVPPEELGVETPVGGIVSRVSWVRAHETADIAVLALSGFLIGGETHPFWGVVSNWSLGEEFMAYGYPADVLGREPDQPTERLFRGYYQRFMRHRGHLGYAYLAAELSIPSPAGLSGGPLFRPQAHPMLVAMATENLQSTTYLEEVEIEDQPGHRTERRFERVIQYGVALLLSDLSEWLEGFIPPRDSSDLIKGPRTAPDL